MPIPVTHNELLPLANTEPIAIDDIEYPEKMELLRSTTVEVLDAALCYVDLSVAEAATIVGAAATSTTPLGIGLGLKTLTVGTDKGFVPGMRIKVSAAIDPDARMIGTVADYAGDQLIVRITDTSGSGNYSAWGVAPVAEADLPLPYVAGQVLSNDGAELRWINPHGELHRIALLTSEFAMVAAGPRAIYIDEARQVGGSVRLPDATALAVGEQVDIYLTRGIVVIRDGAGAAIGSISAGPGYSTTSHYHERLRLHDNSTPGGVWLALERADVSATGMRSVPYDSAHASQNASFTAQAYDNSNALFDLGGGRYLQAALGGHNVCRAFSVTDYPLTLSFGTAAALAPTVYGATPCLVGSKLLVPYNNNASGTSLRLALCSVAGTVVSGPYTTSVPSSDSSYTGEVNLVCPLSATTALWIYSRGQTLATYTRIVTISGNSATAAAESMLGSSLYYTSGVLIPVSASRVLWVYGNPQQSSYITARILTIAGNTVTVGSPVVIASLYYSSPSFAVLDASTVALSNYGYLYIINTDGATPSVTASQALPSAGSVPLVSLSGELYLVGNRVYRLRSAGITPIGPEMSQVPGGSLVARPGGTVLSVMSASAAIFYPLAKE